jgi:polyribonucleotide nucleotidyltransferase
MDIKITGVTKEILSPAQGLDRAGQLHIWARCRRPGGAARGISKYAPRFTTYDPPERFKESWAGRQGHPRHHRPHRVLV